MSDPQNGNLFDLPDGLQRGGEEFFQHLAEGKNVRIERIVSTGQSSPEDFWYDQADDEWVVLLTGRAELEFKDGGVKSLQPGDWINIPAHKKHRVRSTAKDTETIWLAVHYSS